MENKRALSPIIATVLLIAIIVIIALIVFVWLRSTVKPAIVKFDKNIELVCDEDVSFNAAQSSAGELQIVNNGNVPIYSVKIRKYSGGSYETSDIRDMASEWPGDGLAQGSTYSEQLSLGNYDKILVIPVLLGMSEDGETSYECDERTGIEVIIN